ncbi:MAG: hypothetical protein Q7J31_19150 [Syntrophales bacterium]|nr:hypothetical protein [Syntrophales bacterium]
MELLKWIIPLLASLAGIVVPIVLSPSAERQKALAYEVLSVAEIRPPSGASLNDMRVTLGNKVLENVGITLVQIINNGKTPINKADFDRSLAINVQQGTQLLRSSVVGKLETG